MSGYCCQAIFRTINGSDIDSVEKFVREEVSSLWQEKKLDLPYGCQSKDAFGFYANCPSRFKFSPGDKKLINIIIDHLKLSNTNDEKNGTKPIKSEKIPNSKVLSSDTAQRTTYFINKLRSNAETNFDTSKNGYRYDSETKMYASYLRMICGPLGYNTIQRNLEGAIPSLVSTNRYINETRFYVAEGALRCQELLQYLKERNLPLAICLGEDATRIEGRVQYNRNTNQIVGFTLPIDKNTGMPIPYSYSAKNAEEILKHFSDDNSISSYVNTIMAQPLGNYPSFCLSIFGSDGKYSSKDVENRWTFITSQLIKLNIRALIISSDSEPRYNYAMRKMFSLNFESVRLNSSSIETKNIRGPFFVQDPTHIGTKLRNFLLKFSNKKLLSIGPKFSIDMGHLHFLLNFPKDQHLLTASVLNPSDRQNFSSVLRMCSVKVTNLLKTNVKDSNGTIYFLEMIRDVLDSYMDVNLSPLDRVEKIWYHLFILRIWRHHVKSEKKSLMDNFLTSNCFSCIELNAYSLLLCLMYLYDQNLPSWFLPHLFNSQSCESIFRQMRSFTSTYSTKANCSVNEILYRISKIQLQNEIVHSNATNFVYPKATQKKDKNVLHTLPTKFEIFNTVALCKTRAIKTAKQFGFKIPNDSSLVSCTIGVKCLNKRPIKIKTNVKRINPFNKPIRKVSDLNNVNLVNYIDTHPYPDEMSPFVKINEKKVVKKTSLCWYLRNDYQKLSSDRNKRVMTKTDNDYLSKNKKNKVKTFQCPNTMSKYKIKYKPISKKNAPRKTIKNKINK